MAEGKREEPTGDRNRHRPSESEIPSPEPEPDLDEAENISEEEAEEWIRQKLRERMRNVDWDEINRQAREMLEENAEGLLDDNTEPQFQGATALDHVRLERAVRTRIERILQEEAVRGTIATLYGDNEGYGEPVDTLTFLLCLGDSSEAQPIDDPEPDGILLDIVYYERSGQTKYKTTISRGRAREFGGGSLLDAESVERMADLLNDPVREVRETLEEALGEIHRLVRLLRSEGELPF